MELEGRGPYPHSLPSWDEKGPRVQAEDGGDAPHGTSLLPRQPRTAEAGWGRGDLRERRLREALGPGWGWGGGGGGLFDLAGAPRN